MVTHVKSPRSAHVPINSDKLLAIRKGMADEISEIFGTLVATTPTVFTDKYDIAVSNREDRITLFALYIKSAMPNAGNWISSVILRRPK
jgi:hypothetical protein